MPYTHTHLGEKGGYGAAVEVKGLGKNDWKNLCKPDCTRETACSNLCDTSRTFTSLFAGVAAGIMGINGWINGALFYLAVSVPLSCVLSLTQTSFGDISKLRLGLHLSVNMG